MSTKYKATAIGEAYFITIIAVGWIDVFTRLRQKYVLITPMARICHKSASSELYSVRLRVWILKHKKGT